MKKRFLTGFLILGLAMALLTGCGNSGGTTPTAAPTQEAAAEPSATQEPTPAHANEITIGIAQDLDESLDPHHTVAAGTREVMFNVFEGLVKPTSEGDLVPAVASEVRVAEDGLSYSFTLRPGVKFHNGAPVTMQDVLFSIRRNMPDEEGNALIPALSRIADLQGEGDTLTVTLTDPDPEFLSYMTLAILPENYADQASAPVGTGPFRFVSRTAQDSIVLERFADYWGTPARLDKVTYKISENVEGLILGLQSGALDLVAHLSSTQTAQLNEADFHIEQGTMNLVQALYLNNAVSPFDDVRVRQALCYAVDKHAVIDLAFDGYGHPLGSSMYPAFGKYFDESLTDYYPHDVEKAKALLAEAGYADGFSMSITVPSNYQPHMDTAQVLVEQLKEIGVTATIQPVEWASWVSDTYQGRNYQSTVVGVDASDMTARAMLARFQSESDKNFVNYKNDEYDALFAQALSCWDDAEQTEIYRQMERNLTENAANVYIQDLADLVAVRNGLEGLAFYPLYVLDVSTLYWAE